MSDKKIDETEAMFIKASKPKLDISEIEPITGVGVIYDGTNQGKEALRKATELANRFHIPLTVVTADDYLEPFKTLAMSTNKKIQTLSDYVDQFTKDNGVAANVDIKMGERVNQILNIFEREPVEDEKLSSKLVAAFKEKQFDILVTGAPLFRQEKEESYFGFYLQKLLSDAEIRSNFLIVSENREDLTKKILSFVSVDQQPSSIVALTRRSLSIANGNKAIKLIGVVEDKIIETVARAELKDQETDEDLNLIEVRNRLKSKMEDTLASIKIAKNIPYKSFDFKVSTGIMSSNIKTTLDEEKPALVLVRSVSRLDQYLDPVAEQIALNVLNAGYPVLLVWD